MKVGGQQRELGVEGDCSRGKGGQGRDREGQRQGTKELAQWWKWGIDKRTVWGLFAIIRRSYILIQGGLCAVFRAGNSTGDRCNIYILGMKE